MKNNRGSFTLFLLVLLLMSADLIFAQDARVPGGEQKIPLGANVRNGKMIFRNRGWNFPVVV